MIIKRKKDPKIGDSRIVKRFFPSLFGVSGENENGEPVWIWFQFYYSHERYTKRLRPTKFGIYSFADWDVYKCTVNKSDNKLKISTGGYQPTRPSYSLNPPKGYSSVRKPK